RHRPGRPFAIRSSAEQTFYDPEFAALLERTIYLHDIDLIQFEYTQLAQYHLPLESLPQWVFERDIYFRSVQRQLLAGEGGILAKAHEFVEWLRGMRYETCGAEKFDAIFTCHGQEERLLQSYLRHPDGRVVGGLRVAIAVADYPYPGGPRLADSLLFVGSFQHRPNVEGLSYFTREILPLIRAARPATVLHVVGSGAAPQQREELARDGIEFLGQVADIRLPLARY